MFGSVAKGPWQNHSALALQAEGGWQGQAMSLGGERAGCVPHLDLNSRVGRERRARGQQVSGCWSEGKGTGADAGVGTGPITGTLRRIWGW